MLFAFVVFFLSLAAIGALFGVKHWEMTRNRVLAPEWRRKGDMRAEQLKILIVAGRKDLEKIPPILLHLFHTLVHEGALLMAASARSLEAQAHRLADFVSHKRGFERRETRSEFLRKVAEHKNGNGSKLDTTSDNGQNS